MLAAFVERTDPHDPVGALAVGDRPEPVVPEGWEIIEVKAASINRHDLFSLAGQGLPDKFLPMIIGCDASGVTRDGREVVVHAVLPSPQWSGDELADPGLSMLSERTQGTFAERVAVPTRNLVAKPEKLTFEEAACLPTAWVTAYRMLYGQADLKPGQTVLIQGVAGGLSSALIALARVGGLRTWVTTRNLVNEQYAADMGADAVFEAGARMPERVDAVMDSVGGSTWEHSMKSLKPTGALVAAGGTAGFEATVNVARVFANRLKIVGSAMGTFEDLSRVVNLCATRGLRPHIHSTFKLSDARPAIKLMAEGGVRGKLVLTS